MKKRKTDYRPVYQALTMISQFGINMLVPICLMTAFGVWLDNRLGTSYWVVVLFFVGAIAGFQNVYRMAKGFWKTPKGESNQKDGGKDKKD